MGHTELTVSQRRESGRQSTHQPEMQQPTAFGSLRLRPGDYPQTMSGAGDHPTATSHSVLGLTSFDDLTERELPRLTRDIRKRLAQRRLDEATIETLLPQILEQALLAGFERLRQKPEPMSLQGWLALQVRPLIERLTVS